MRGDQSVVALLDEIPQERLSSEEKKRLVKLHNTFIAD